MLKLSDPDLARLRVECIEAARHMVTPRMGLGTTGMFVAWDDVERTAETIFNFALNPPPDAPPEETA